MIRALVYRTAAGIGRARYLWRNRHATAIAVNVRVRRPLLRDAPTIRNVLDSGLRNRLAATGSPLAWRYADLRWLTRQARAVAAGHRIDIATCPTYPLEVRLVEDDPDAFVRDEVLIVAEQRRKERTR